ncbi:hypothetical protein GGI07_003212 [Coemansia sp. Benny D115]|nr:hypothetical protein GGI07_003212 [Coemansia sp. Benny D115]
MFSRIAFARHALTPRIGSGFRQKAGYLRVPDFSNKATPTVRVSNLPPGLSPTDIRHTIIGDTDLVETKSLHFEYDQHLSPLNSVRITFFSVKDAASFHAKARRMKLYDNNLKAEYVTEMKIKNPNVTKYLGSASMDGRIVLISGYPPYMNEHQLRDYFDEYEIVDSSIPAIQRAPVEGGGFLVRRGAFIVQFLTASEASRFVRDTNMTEFVDRKKIDESAAALNADDADDADDGAATAFGREQRADGVSGATETKTYMIKARLLY